MRKTIPVCEYMSRLPEQIDRRDVLSTAIERMRNHRIRHVPVMDGPRIFGILSRTDVEMAWRRHGPSAGESPVGEVCTVGAVTVSPVTAIPDVARRMLENRVRSVLVAEDGVLVGIFTSVDALRVLAGLSASANATAERSSASES